MLRRLATVASSLGNRQQQQNTTSGSSTRPGTTAPVLHRTTTTANTTTATASASSSQSPALLLLPSKPLRAAPAPAAPAATSAATPKAQQQQPSPSPSPSSPAPPTHSQQQPPPSPSTSASQATPQQLQGGYYGTGGGPDPPGNEITTSATATSVTAEALAPGSTTTTIANSSDYGCGAHATAKESNSTTTCTIANGASSQCQSSSNLTTAANPSRNASPDTGKTPGGGASGSSTMRLGASNTNLLKPVPSGPEESTGTAYAQRARLDANDKSGSDEWKGHHKRLTATRMHMKMAEFLYTETEIVTWIETTLKVKFTETRSLQKICEDGTVMCKLLACLAPDMKLPPFHFKPSATAQKIENINFFLLGCKRLHMPVDNFAAQNLIDNKHLDEVISILSYLMKRALSVPTTTGRAEVTVKLAGPDSTPLDVTFSAMTPVIDVKKKIAEIKNISPTEIEHYGLYTVDPALSQPVWIDEEATLDEIPLDSQSLQFEKMKKRVKDMVKKTCADLPLILDLTAKKGFQGPNLKIPARGLIPNDAVQFYSWNIVHIHTDSFIFGTLFVTKYNIIFEPYAWLPQSASNSAARPVSRSCESGTSMCSRQGFRVPLATISKITATTGISRQVGKYKTFELVCKDFNEVRFSYLVRMGNPLCDPVVQLVDRHKIPENNFQYAFCIKGPCGEHDGWKVYDPPNEFARMGIPCKEWRLSQINSAYVASSYPRTLCVPSAIDDTQLEKVMHFRSKGRIPAVVFRFQLNGTVMLRCSQPAVGMLGKRCEEDELLFATLANPLCSPAPTHRVLIFDARPKINALANKLKGMGYETYSNCKMSFLGIENIHAIRESFKKLRAVVNLEPYAQSSDKFEASKWPAHIVTILRGSYIISAFMQKGEQIVVHCSDGWDRTSQLTALSQMILDPYYRTLVGFEVLIEKEWLSFGHKFSTRVGHATADHKDQERSPIFLQFLDCVYQIWFQYKSAFEFTDRLLETIAEHHISCCFGTFLFNSEQERMHRQLPAKTVSLWSHINFHSTHFTNTTFAPTAGPLIDSPTCGKLGGNLTPLDVRLWPYYYVWRNYHYCT
ncbi:myotubularin-related protein 1/2 [Pelomyxa schiedti]|nr:myotubularin-related protein 1/2 [Pelomyxa schiedti]